jgi:glutamyl-tRNA synthetase
VDDIRDGITHIIRGQDGLANTPKQILIYRALDISIPKFAHMPLTLDSKKAKISKRKHGEIVAVHFYREHGFLPWALVNFLALLGWSTVDSKQIFSREELLKAFSLEAINRSNSIFDIRQDDPKFFTDPKALAINSHYIKSLPLEELAPYVKIELEKAKIWDTAYETEKRDWYLQTLDLIRSRYHVTTDFVTLGRAYFSDDFEIDPKALKKNVLKHDKLKEWLPLIAERLDKLEEYSLEGTERVIRGVAEELNVKPGVLINGIRSVVTGQAVGPGLFDVLMAIGRDRVVARLRKTPTLFEEDLD